MQTVHHVAVIGGGVVGCAVLKAFTSRGLTNCILLEQNNDVITGASAGNSGIFHTGFDAKPNTLELQCMKQGHKELMQLMQMEPKLPILKTGAMVVAWNQEQANALPGILHRGHENGVTVAMLSPQEVLKLEPKLAKHVKGAVYVPDECIVCPWTLPLVYLHQALSTGATLKRNCKVTAAKFHTTAKHKLFNPEVAKDGYWELTTTSGTILASVVVNCAGNFGDIVERMNPQSNMDFKITPRKGQFVMYEPKASALINTMILPVPTERIKGVIVFKTIHGNLIVGPTAEDQEERVTATVDARTLSMLNEKGIEMVPQLQNMKQVNAYAGLRPASLKYNDYQINVPLHNKLPTNWITVGAIRSTGLTAALGIAHLVWKLYNKYFVLHNVDPKWTIEVLNTLPDESKVSWQPIPPILMQMGTAKSSKVTVNQYSHTVQHPIWQTGVLPSKL